MEDIKRTIIENINNTKEGLNLLDIKNNFISELDSIERQTMNSHTVDEVGDVLDRLSETLKDIKNHVDFIILQI